MKINENEENKIVWYIGMSGGGEYTSGRETHSIYRERSADTIAIPIPRPHLPIVDEYIQSYLDNGSPFRLRS
jgi:hypothetical protein